MPTFCQLRHYLLCLLLVLLPSAGLCHPHVWVDKGVTVVFGEQGMQGFVMRWTFDEIFSEEILDLAGADGTQFTDSQISLIKREFFDNLRHFNYFTRIWIDGREFTVNFVRDFAPRTENRRVIYEFFVPCTVTATDSAKEVRLLVQDPEIFVDFTWDRHQPILFEQPATLATDHELRIDRSRGFFGGIIAPRILHVRFRKSP